MIEGKIHIKERPVALVVGAGGAARAVVEVMRDLHIPVTIAARSPEKARASVPGKESQLVGLEEIVGSRSDFDIVVNCTPLGTRGQHERSGLDARLFKRGGLFLDLVYNPPVTTSMTRAKAKGTRAYGGLEMLVHQGAESFRLWTGRQPDVRAMFSSARRALR